MYVMKILILILLMVGDTAVCAFELATKIYQEGTATTLQTTGYAHIPLLRQEVSLTGVIVVMGRVTIKGIANIVMWSKVDGVYYFTKLPGLKNVRDVEDLNINIPFNAADRTISEVVIEVEMLSGGSVSIRDLSVKGRQ
jgi:hypothetical protein